MAPLRRASCSCLVGTVVGRIDNRARWAQLNDLTHCIRSMTDPACNDQCWSCDFQTGLLASI
jgi:hypothetical protein